MDVDMDIFNAYEPMSFNIGNWFLINKQNEMSAYCLKILIF